MLWYGYIYYFFFFFFFFFSLIFFFRLLFINIFYKINIFSNLLKNILSFFSFFSFLALLFIYNMLDFYASFNIIFFKNPINIIFFDLIPNNYILNSFNLGLNLVDIYCFPFIYIFIIITIISVLFCLSYNISETMGFMFYCTIILVSGYVLFFTDSIILFFFAYEMLLVPSFFILYNFAKTRRCVEAAYLMFFWTQFGAMFLIFSFLYFFLYAVLLLFIMWIFYIFRLLSWTFFFFVD